MGKLWRDCYYEMQITVQHDDSKSYNAQLFPFIVTIPHNSTRCSKNHVDTQRKKGSWKSIRNMWRYEFLKFKFEISKCDFDMFSYVFIRFRNKISNVWKICWRHPHELKFYVWSGIVSNFCFGKFKQLLLCKFTEYDR